MRLGLASGRSSNVERRMVNGERQSANDNRRTTIKGYSVSLGCGEGDEIDYTRKTLQGMYSA